MLEHRGREEVAEAAADQLLGRVAEPLGGGGIHGQEDAGQVVGADQSRPGLHQRPIGRLGGGREGNHRRVH